MKEILSQYQFGSTTLRYYIDTKTQNVGMVLLPGDMVSAAGSAKNSRLEPLVQLKIQGDVYPFGFAHGHSMRGSETVFRFKYDKQRIIEDNDSKTVVTVLREDRGLVSEHHLRWYSGYSALESSTAFKNESQNEVCLEMLSSFSMGEITPFEPDDAPGALVLHRLRSSWSAEGKLESIAIEDLGMEPSWASFGTRCERFGQVGSMPVRKFFPYAVIEDRKNQCTEHLLKRDGYVITVGDRRFLDMSDPYVRETLNDKVIHFLKKYKMGYIKIDYNDNIGIGCDGAESLGESLRQKVLATQQFIEEMQMQIPNLVIENCSSGGHRLEPSMMCLTSMSSFSDAHECVEIPIIAANLHRAMFPRQSQIGWKQDYL